MLQLLDLAYLPIDWFFHLPEWLGYLIAGLLITYTLAMAGFVLARMGIKPLWSLVLLVPYLNVIGMWALAYKKWSANRLPED